jgi:hypothetical protein
MLQACVLWVGLLIGGALAIHDVGWLAGLVPSRFLGVGTPGSAGPGLWAHCWVLRERARELLVSS